jgi:hypothetical protein
MKQTKPKPSNFTPIDKKKTSPKSPNIDEFDLDENIQEMDEEVNHEVSSKNFEAKSKNGAKNIRYLK